MKRNLTPLIGLITGFILIILSITMSGSIASFISFSSIIITILGSFCALVISFPLKILIKIPQVLKVLLTSPDDKRSDLVILFTELAKKARRDGLLALEDDMENIDDEFLKTGLQMVVDGVEPGTIKEILEIKLDTIENRHRSGQDVFLKWGELAPAFGMLGTLIGLIIMLARLDDASSIGQGMATALITTFYGSLFANLVFLPIANNLSVQTDEEIFTGEMIIEGILEIQAGSNPRLIEEKLMTYLSPEEIRDLKETKDNNEILREVESYE